MWQNVAGGAIPEPPLMNRGEEILMKHFIIALLLLTACEAALGAPAGKETERLEKAAEVINEIMGTPENSIPRDLLNKAVCVGIIPSQKKFAMGIGGSFGRGALLCRRGGNGSWGAPSMFTLRGGNIGFQLGGSATDVVFIVMNPKGVGKLLQSKSELGADAQAAAGPVGRTASVATDLQMSAEILTYSRSKGLFAGVSLKGSVLNQDHDANRRLYGRDMTPEDILIRGRVAPPGAARALVQALTKYSPRGGQSYTPK